MYVCIALFSGNQVDHRMSVHLFKTTRSQQRVSSVVKNQRVTVRRVGTKSPLSYFLLTKPLSFKGRYSLFPQSGVFVVVRLLLDIILLDFVPDSSLHLISQLYCNSKKTLFYCLQERIKSASPVLKYSWMLFLKKQYLLYSSE